MVQAHPGAKNSFGFAIYIKESKVKEDESYQDSSYQDSYITLSTAMHFVGNFIQDALEFLPLNYCSLVDSNYQPFDYQTNALTICATKA